MDHISYLRNILMADVVESDCKCRQLQIEIVDSCINNYMKCNYFSVELMIKDALFSILKLKPLSIGVSAQEYAVKLSISVGTSRRWLNKIDGILCDKSNKPHIFNL